MKTNFLIRLLAALALVSLLALFAIQSHAQTVGLMPEIAIPQFFDNNGVPCSGCKIYSYAAGTSTPLATYTDFTGVVSNSNPIVLSAAGRPVDGTNIYLGSVLYKIVLANPAGATIRTQDNVSNQGLITLTKAVLLAPAGGAEQDVAGIVGATSFHGTGSHTTSTGVRVAILDPATVLDSASNPPSLIVTSPVLANSSYYVPDCGNVTCNFVLSPGTSTNALDCTATGLNCKRYAFLWFPGGSCNNTTAAMGWDTFGTNSPTNICVTGTNIQKGVLALPSAATLYQQNTNSAAAAGTCTVTYPQATIAGDLLLGFTMLDGTKTVTGVTDGTNAYTQATTVTSGVYRLSVYYFNGSSTAMAASSTLTFTFSAAANSVCGFLAYKDIKTAALLDVTATNSGSGTAVTTGTTAGTAQNTELVVSFVGSASNPSVTFNSGNVGHTTVSQSTNVTGSSQGRIQQATSTQSEAFTLGAANTWLSSIVTFKANVGNLTAGQRAFQLPPTYLSTIAQTPFLKWQAPLLPTGTVNVRLGAAVVCTADGSTDDAVFNAPSYATTAVNASSTGVVTQTAPGNLTLTGCAAGNTEHLQVIRNRYDSNDTYEGFVYLNGLGLQLGIQ